MQRAAIVRALAASEEELGQVLALLRLGGLDEPERLSLGAGDRRLLALHRDVVDAELELVVECSACGATNAAALGPEAVPDVRPRMAVLGPGGGVREPTYEDLLGLPDDPDEAERRLLRRCTVGAPAREATAAELVAVDDCLAGPIVLACAECDAAMEAPVDVERLVLESLQRHVDAIDVEIHLLARAYHWTLDTIEELPDDRRSRMAALVEEGW